MNRTSARARRPAQREAFRRVRARRLVLAITLVAVAGAWAGPIARATSGTPEPVTVARSTYVVQRGDSLWRIAEDLSDGADPRPLVDAIAEMNRVEPSAIVPGQTLVIPAG